LLARAKLARDIVENQELEHRDLHRCCVFAAQLPSDPKELENDMTWSRRAVQAHSRLKHALARMDADQFDGRGETRQNY
jgi:hypothetical protein